MTEAVTHTTIDVLSFIRLVEGKAIANEPLTVDEAVDFISLPTIHIFDIIAAANRVRRHHKGDEVALCSIINAKSGRCKENCSFCSQSIHANTDAPVFDLVTTEQMVEGAKSAAASGAKKYGIVTSGYGYNSQTRDSDLDAILNAVDAIGEATDIQRCASLGIIDDQTAARLRDAGVKEYHHNVETARSFFPNVCTTHDYEEDVETVRVIKRAGLKACSGGIFGLGESPAQRVEMAFTLRELDVDSVPLNFLNPIEGTKLAGATPIPPLEILQIIAAYRMILPTKDIKVAGGREKNLRDLQSMIFAAGANSTMVGNYLTTMGRPAADDLQMISDLGLTVRDS
jgi:biotin synthase